MIVSTREADVRATGVVLDNGPAVDEVVIHASGASYDADRRTFSLSGQATLAARISADSILQYVRENPPDAVQDLQVTLLDGSVRVSARMQGLLPLGVEAVGSLEIVQGTQIAFRPSSVRVAGMGAPGSLVERVLENVNPLLDLAALPFPVSLQRVEVSLGEVRVHALCGPIGNSGTLT